MDPEQRGSVQRMREVRSVGHDEDRAQDASERQRYVPLHGLPAGLSLPEATRGAALPGYALTAAALDALAASDLLPVAQCLKCDWVPVDCPVLDDGLVMRCPCCFHAFRAEDVLFMDDAARRAHGFEVTIIDQDVADLPEWPVAPLRG